MSHVDPDQLALIALGAASPTPAEDEHLRACGDCRSEEEALRRTAAVARANVSPEELERPPARVWARIADELQLAQQDEAEPAPVRSLPRETASRRRRWLLPMAAGLVLLAGAGIASWAITASRPTDLAEAVLTALPEHPGLAGTADVREDGGGTREIRVTLDGDRQDTSPGYREVWLLNSDASALISLGVLEGDSGTFTVPVDIDLDEYRVVDISVESLDGDPAHSGDSLVRGSLTFI
ncbi:anti-sigma factor [Microbacterium sp. P05]|uniref:anti-sigma factor n=1 Tax=Microbacterium sp. P05 TaxID=3366948 RepID=UPI0037463231